MSSTHVFGFTPCSTRHNFPARPSSCCSSRFRSVFCCKECCGWARNSCSSETLWRIWRISAFVSTVFLSRCLRCRSSCYWCGCWGCGVRRTFVMWWTCSRFSSYRMSTFWSVMVFTFSWVFLTGWNSPPNRWVSWCTWPSCILWSWTSFPCWTGRHWRRCRRLVCGTHRQWIFYCRQSRWWFTSHMGFLLRVCGRLWLLSGSKFTK